MTRRMRLLIFAIFNILLSAPVVILLLLGWQPDGPTLVIALVVVVGLAVGFAWLLERGWG